MLGSEKDRVIFIFLKHKLTLLTSFKRTNFNVKNLFRKNLYYEVFLVKGSLFQKIYQTHFWRVV
jgi:hypothetical protein